MWRSSEQQWRVQLLLLKTKREASDKGGIFLVAFKSWHSEEIIDYIDYRSPSWPRSSEETLKTSWRKLLDKRTSGLFCSPRCHCDSDPEKRHVVGGPDTRSTRQAMDWFSVGSLSKSKRTCRNPHHRRRYQTRWGLRPACRRQCWRPPSRSRPSSHRLSLDPRCLPDEEKWKQTGATFIFYIL